EEEARGLEGSASGEDPDADFHPAALEHGELAALLVELHVRRALAVAAEDVALVDDNRGVVEIRAARFVVADDARGRELLRAVEQLPLLRPVPPPFTLTHAFLPV